MARRRVGNVHEPGHGRGLRRHPVAGAHGQRLPGEPRIAAALAAGADVVITGRVTDAALVVGPASWWHSWDLADESYLDAIAGAVVAGHVIECGTQATGGNYAFFTDVPGLTHPGFPIAEVAHDGSAVILKHWDTGGLVSVGTVTSQLVYEIGAPEYPTPDAIALFDTDSNAGGLQPGVAARNPWVAAARALQGGDDETGWFPQHDGPGPHRPGSTGQGRSRAPIGRWGFPLPKPPLRESPRGPGRPVRLGRGRLEVALLGPKVSPTRVTCPMPRRSFG